MGKPNTARQIRERRDKIRHLLARGYSQGDIMRELGIATISYNRDMKSINEMSNKELYEMAKSPPVKVYSDCVRHLDKIINECWKIYNDPDTSANDKLYTLRIISENKIRKHTIFQEILGNHRHEHDLT